MFLLYARAFVPTSVRDTQVGAKAFAGPWLELVLPQTREAGFLFDLELLCAARAGGHKVIELPVSLSIDGATSTISAVTALRMAGQVLALGVRTRRGCLLSPGHRQRWLPLNVTTPASDIVSQRKSGSTRPER